jgi:hypothetical protein
MIPHLSRRKADLLEGWPATDGLFLALEVSRDVLFMMDVHGESGSDGVKADGRHVKSVNDGEVSLHVNLIGIYLFIVLGSLW